MNVIVSNKYQSLLGSLNIDVIKSINGEFTVDELVAQFSSFYYNKMIIDITAISDYENINVMQNLSMNFDMSKCIILLDDSEIVNSPMYLSQLVSMGIYNFTGDINSIKYLIDNPNSYKDVANYHNINGFKKKTLNEKSEDSTRGKIVKRVIGFDNLTEHAGASTLIYLLYEQLSSLYKVKAVEVDKKDFTYLDDSSLDSISSLDMNNYLADNSDNDVILVDINGADLNSYCTDVIYLIEPGLIPLNRLVKSDSSIFQKLADEKVVLNKSTLSSNDIGNFEKESGATVFYSLPYVDDKGDNEDIITPFLIALGFSRFGESSSSKPFHFFK